MINKIKKLSLRKQMVVLFTACIIIVLVTQLFYNISIYKRKTNENTEKCHNTIMQTNSMTDQVLDHIDSVGDSVALNEYILELLYLNSIGSKDIIRRGDLKEILYMYIRNIIKANNMLIDIAIVDTKDAINSATSLFNYGTYKNLINNHDIQNLGRGIYTSDLSLREGLYANKCFAYIIPIYNSSGEFMVSAERLGTCIICVKNTPLVEVVNSTAATKEATVLVTDDKGLILALNSAYSADEINDEIGNMIKNYPMEGQSKISLMDFMGRESFVLVNRQATTGWYSINIVPTKEVYKESFDTFYLGIIVSLLSIIIVSLFGFYVTSSITKPLKQITDALDKIGNGSRKHRISVTEQNEFGIISDRINSMLDNMNIMDRQIFDMQSQLYEKELIQKEAEMLTLQSQINPHFLYNTLECIRSISTVYKIKEIPIITTSMAKIFRYSIKGGKVTTIKKELESLEDYYKIISIRYNDRFALITDIDETMLPYSMLKISLQPVLENTVNYCLEATENKVTVNIHGYIDGEYAILKISDDGIGMDPAKVQEMNETFQKSPKQSFYELEKARGSIGLSNIDMRIKLHYGDDCGLRIESTKDVGTTVVIKIRLLIEKE